MHWAPPAYPKTLRTLYKSCHKSSRRLFLTNKHKITVALVTPDRYRAVRTYISLRSLVSGNIYQKEAHWCIKHEKIQANVKGKTILFFSFSKNSFILIIFSVNKVNIFCYFASQVNPSRACFDRRTRDWFLSLYMFLYQYISSTDELFLIRVQFWSGSQVCSVRSVYCSVAMTEFRTALMW